MNYTPTNEETAHLNYIAQGKGLLRTADEQSLANTCLHYLRRPYGDDGFRLRSGVLFYLELCLETYGNDTKLLGIAEKLVPPADPLSLAAPYRSAAWNLD